MMNFTWRKRRVAAVVIPATVLSLLAAVPLSVNAFAQGGTAKPPKGAIAPFVTATMPDPVTSVLPGLIRSFDDTGFIQGATVDATNAKCPGTTDRHRFGGTLTLNHGPIVIPCNLVIQLAANTMTWADFVDGPAAPDQSVGSLAPGTGYPSFEMNAVGNIVGARRIAGLLYGSQQSLNGSTGVITAIDYVTGRLNVDTGNPAAPAVVEINDPNGRFGRAKSPDARFSVDDANPTIHGGTAGHTSGTRRRLHGHGWTVDIAHRRERLCRPGAPLQRGLLLGGGLHSRFGRRPEQGEPAGHPGRGEPRPQRDADRPDHRCDHPIGRAAIAGVTPNSPEWLIDGIRTVARHLQAPKRWRRVTLHVRSTDARVRALCDNQGPASRADLDPVPALGHRPVTARRKVLQNTATALDHLGGAHVVVIAGHQHTLKANRRRDRQGLAQDGRRVTAATKTRAHPVSDVSPYL